MRIVPMFDSFTHGKVQGITSRWGPEDEVIARSIFGATSYLLCTEERFPTEKDGRMLKLLQDKIPGQKGYILELWEKIEDPSRVQAIAKERDPNVEEVRQRLLEELKSKGSFGL